MSSWENKSKRYKKREDRFKDKSVDRKLNVSVRSWGYSPKKNLQNKKKMLRYTPIAEDF